ncbi:MAG: preprotein translocase subunit SecE [Phycisphaerales bacterium]
MQAGLYKKGQGYYVRLCSAIALGTIALLGGRWMWDQLKGVEVGTMRSEYVQMSGAVLMISIFAIVGFWLIGRKPGSVDFLIACEAEMKKVNWSTRREIIGSTWVVIALAVFIAAFLFLWDFLFQLFFRAIGVLQGAG